jgi:hypothetical protein
LYFSVNKDNKPNAGSVSSAAKFVLKKIEIGKPGISVL